MADSTSTQRRQWAPPCERHGDLTEAYDALDAWFEAFGYAVGPGSGAANCRPITGGTGYSLHAYAFGSIFRWWNDRAFAKALAVDINPSKNPYGPRLVTDMPPDMVRGIVGIRTRNGKQVWVWGGTFTPMHDAMHYQVGCSPADLATGIDPATLPRPDTEEETMRTLVVCRKARENEVPKSWRGAWFAIDGATRKWIPTPGHAAEQVRLGHLDKAVPEQVSPSLLKELEPVGPIDDAPGSGFGPGGHFRVDA